MFCPNCGAEIVLEEIFNEVKYGICESCNHEFSVKDYGQTTADKIARAQKKFQARYEKNVKGYEQVNKTLSRIRNKSDL